MFQKHLTEVITFLKCKNYISRDHVIKLPGCVSDDIDLSKDYVYDYVLFQYPHDIVLYLDGQHLLVHGTCINTVSNEIIEFDSVNMHVKL